MNLTAADIDRIVTEVVRRLRALAATSSTTAPSQKPETQSSLNLNDKVITLATLKGKLEGITTVIVSDRAIVTPAVKDELRDRKIRWERSTTKARS
jgi:hypothetical protein